MLVLRSCRLVSQLYDIVYLSTCVLIHERFALSSFSASCMVIHVPYQRTHWEFWRENSSRYESGCRSSHPASELSSLPSERNREWQKARLEHTTFLKAKPTQCWKIKTNKKIINKKRSHFRSRDTVHFPKNAAQPMHHVSFNRVAMTFPLFIGCHYIYPILMVGVIFKYLIWTFFF